MMRSEKKMVAQKWKTMNKTFIKGLLGIKRLICVTFMVYIPVLVRK